VGSVMEERSGLIVKTGKAGAHTAGTAAEVSISAAGETGRMIDDAGEARMHCTGSAASRISAPRQVLRTARLPSAHRETSEDGRLRARSGTPSERSLCEKGKNAQHSVGLGKKLEDRHPFR